MSDRSPSATRRLTPALALLVVAGLAAGLGGFFGIRAVIGRGAASTAAATPPARTGAAMAFDAATGEVVMFGGVGVRGPLADTWTWDGSGWTQRHTTESPPAGGPAVMAFDPRGRDVLLVTLTPSPLPAEQPEGLGVPSAKTWVWDGSSWHHTGAAALAAAQVRMATDSADGYVLLIGSEPIVPRPLPPCHEVVPPAAGPLPGCGAATRSPHTTTWRWTGGSWADTGAGGPGGQDQQVWEAAGSALTDPSSGRPVSFSLSPSLPLPCPVQVLPAPSMPAAPPAASTPPEPIPHPLLTPPSGGGPPAVLPDPGPLTAPHLTPPCPIPATGPSGPTMSPLMSVSHWDGARWARPQRIAAPGNGFDVMALSPEAGSTGILALDTVRGLTWAFDGSGWHQLATGSALPRAAEPGVAYDAGRRTLLLFGGTVVRQASEPPEAAVSSRTWTWDGSRWSQHGGSLEQLPLPTAISGSIVPQGTPAQPSLSSPAGS